MKKMNRLMKQELMKLPRRSLPLDRRLAAVAQTGHLTADGCFLLKAATGQTNAKISDFPDKTGYECFFNKVHIESASPAEALLQSLLYVKEVFLQWRKYESKGELMAIIGQDIKDGETVVRFHRVRPGESWLASDMESYKEEAILAATSSEPSMWDSRETGVKH